MRKFWVWGLILLLAGITVPGSGQAGTEDEAPSSMVRIPAGKFIMGSKKSLLELNPMEVFSIDRHALGPENPAHEVNLDAYSIDIYEVTNQDYLEYVEATGARKPRFIDKPGFNDPRQPVVGVSWKEARAYCRWKDKRLPTEAEWEKAGRGQRPVRYPWGNEPPDSHRLNYNSEIGKPTPVGTYEQGRSDYGIYDLAGNVSEWVSDWHLAEYYLLSPKDNPPGPSKGQYKVIRGGNWRNDAEEVSLTFRNATVPSLRNDNVGFRCAKSID